MNVHQLDTLIGVAAGYAKTCEDGKRLAKAGIRRIVFGTYMHEDRAGNPGITYQVSFDNASTWNWRGIPGKGLARALAEDIVPFIQWCDNNSAIVEAFVSIASPSAEGLAECARILAEAEFNKEEMLLERIAGVEINGSCQNTESMPIGFDPEAVLTSCRAVTAPLHPLPVGFKLPPYVSQHQLREEACHAAIDGQAARLVTCNTLNEKQLAEAGLAAEVERLFGCQFDRGSFGGELLRELANEELAAVLSHAGGMPVESVGGILCTEEVQRRFRTGARAVWLSSYLHVWGERGLQDLFPALLDLEA